MLNKFQKVTFRIVLLPWLALKMPWKRNYEPSVATSDAMKCNSQKKNIANVEQKLSSINKQSTKIFQILTW